MSTTKEKAALGTQKKVHHYRHHKRENESMIIEYYMKFGGC
jgi:hypothetical protein